MASMALLKHPTGSAADSACNAHSLPPQLISLRECMSLTLMQCTHHACDPAHDQYDSCQPSALGETQATKTYQDVPKSTNTTTQN